jgi:hypothetical protein
MAAGGLLQLVERQTRVSADLRKALHRCRLYAFALHLDLGFFFFAHLPLRRIMIHEVHITCVSTSAPAHAYDVNPERFPDSEDLNGFPSSILVQTGPEIFWLNFSYVASERIFLPVITLDIRPGALNITFLWYESYRQPGLHVQTRATSTYGDTTVSASVSACVTPQNRSAHPSHRSLHRD